MIPFFDLKAQYASIESEISGVMRSVMESGWFILGERLKEFESEFASYTGVGKGLGVGSGTDAIQLALMAAGIKAGEKVATVPNTAVPTVSAIRATGAIPVFVDIDPDTYTMDPDLLADRLQKDGDIKAVVPVHLYGQPADMNPITDAAEAHGAVVIEDACQAHGAEYYGRKTGALGLAGAFSFYPSKNLGAYGDGGFITTSDAELAERLARLRNYGLRDRYNSVSEGINSRLDELQAAALSVKLKYLDGWIKRRREIAALYHDLLDRKKVKRPFEADYAKHSYHLYVIRHPQRGALHKYLSENGVATLIHYPHPIHLQKAYEWLGLIEGSFPEAERAAREILSLPVYPELTDEEVGKVAGLINDFSA